MIFTSELFPVFLKFKWYKFFSLLFVWDFIDRSFCDLFHSDFCKPIDSEQKINEANRLFRCFFLSTVGLFIL
jgi:hypothetical protein